jgi:hypothetical protein
MKPRLASCSYVGVVLFALTFAAKSAGETTTRRYALPDNGFLELQVPGNWREIVRRPPEGGPPTIVFGPDQGTPFEVSVTPAWEQGPLGPDADERWIRQQVEQYLEGVKPNAVEKTIDLVRIDSPSRRGLYFSATDKAPRAGDYKFLTHGLLKAGELAVTFTILTRDGQEQTVSDAMAMLKTAKQVAKQ